MTKKLFFVFSLCCFMLSYSHLSWAGTSSIISPIKAERMVNSPQKTGLKCTFTIGPFIVFIGDSGTGTIAMPSDLSPAGFFEWDFSISNFSGSVLCALFSRP